MTKLKDKPIEMQRLERAFAAFSRAVDELQMEPRFNESKDAQRDVQYTLEGIRDIQRDPGFDFNNFYPTVPDLATPSANRLLKEFTWVLLNGLTNALTYAIVPILDRDEWFEMIDDVVVGWNPCNPEKIDTTITYLKRYLTLEVRLRGGSLASHEKIVAALRKHGASEPTASS